MWKKIIALALLVLICMGAVSCGKSDGTPDGMQAAHLDGEPFRLYVPEGWSVNTASGISGAYTYASDRVIVNARYTVPENADMTVDQYLNGCAERYISVLKDFAVVSHEPAMLGEKDARQLTYTATSPEGVAYTCTQITARHEGLMVSLYFYCPTNSVEATAEAFESIRKAFVFAEISAPINDEVVDEDTPDGMKIASSSDYAYRFYVPKTWICNSQSKKSEAQYPESGNPNVTVTLYEPLETMSIDDYFAMCEARYTESLSGYERLDTTERTVAGRRAVSYTYRARYDGLSFCIMQTVFCDGQIMYSITYTALEEAFDTHTADVNAILDAFSFR